MALPVRSLGEGGLNKPFEAKFMKKAYLKLNRLLGAYSIAAFIAFPISLTGAPALAAEETSANDHSFLAVSSSHNPSGQSNSESKNSLFSSITGVFAKAVYFSQNGNKEEIAVEPVEVANVKKSVIITAYSSTPDQTDDSPFITANGEHVYDGGVACNFLPFGTKIRLPEYSGDKVYTVNDRMAKRFSYKLDIWMETREQALTFGVKKLTVEILK